MLTRKLLFTRNNEERQKQKDEKMNKAFLIAFFSTTRTRAFRFWFVPFASKKGYVISFFLSMGNDKTQQDPTDVETKKENTTE